jgi:cell division protease FtsH
LIDQEVRTLVKEMYQRTIDVLEKNKGSLQAVAEKLLEKETLYKEDLEGILGKRMLPG